MSDLIKQFINKKTKVSITLVETENYIDKLEDVIIIAMTNLGVDITNYDIQYFQSFIPWTSIRIIEEIVEVK